MHYLWRLAFCQVSVTLRPYSYIQLGGERHFKSEKNLGSHHFEVVKEKKNTKKQIRSWYILLHTFIEVPFAGNFSYNFKDLCRRNIAAQTLVYIATTRWVQIFLISCVSVIETLSTSKVFSI